MSIGALNFPGQLTVQIMRSPEELHQYSAVCPQLEGFLFSLPAASTPCCAIVTDDRQTLAVVCAYQRRLNPLRSPVLFVDLALSWFVSGLNWARWRALRAVIRCFLRNPGVRRLRIDVGGSRADITALRDGVRTGEFDFSVLPSGDEHLLTLSAAMCPLEAEPETALYYCPQVPLRAFQQGLWDLMERGAAEAQRTRMRAPRQQRNSLRLWVARLTPRPFCASSSKVDEAHACRALARISQAERSFLVGIRRCDGIWAGLAGGWFEADRLVMALEVLDPGEPRAVDLAPGILEDLARQEVREVLFLTNVHSALPSTNVQRTFQVDIRQCSFGSRLIRRLKHRFSLHTEPASPLTSLSNTPR